MAVTHGNSVEPISLQLGDICCTDPVSLDAVYVDDEALSNEGRLDMCWDSFCWGGI